MFYEGCAYPFKRESSINTYAFYKDLFTPEECKKIIEFGESIKLQNSVVMKEGTKTVSNYRDSKNCWIRCDEKTKWIFERLEHAVKDANNKFFNFDLFGIVEPLQFTRYDSPSGHYHKHVDGYTGNHLPRKISGSLQLSNPNEYKGGDLKLHKERKPQKTLRDIGTLSMFPSFTLHEVTPVTKGTRYSLVFWVTGNPFK